jgi:hypothetical protein
MFKKTLKATMELSNISFFNLAFKDKLSVDYINVLEENNIMWEDEVDTFWATKILSLMNENKSDYFMLWEEDSYLYDSNLFDITFNKMRELDIDFMLIQDEKWIRRARFLNENGYAIDDDRFYYFNWGTNYAKFCRENSNDKLINGAYPVTISGVYKSHLLYKLIDDILSSAYWEKITGGNFSHYHKNPKLPHSFEVYDDFWWPPRGNGNIEYSTIINKIQFGRELGGRLKI